MRKKGSNTFLPVKPSPSAVVSKPFILCTLWNISYSRLEVLALFTLKGLDCTLILKKKEITEQGKLSLAPL